MTAALDFDGIPGRDMCPDFSSTIVIECVAPPRTGHGNLDGSKDIVSPGFCAGRV